MAPQQLLCQRSCSCLWPQNTALYQLQNRLSQSSMPAGRLSLDGGETSGVMCCEVAVSIEVT